MSDNTVAASVYPLFCTSFGKVMQTERTGFELSENRMTIQTLQRLPKYLNLLKEIREKGSCNVSAKLIADELGLVEIQVRKDLASVSSKGRPRIGYVIDELIGDIQNALGYDNLNDAVIVGAGKLGCALLGYDGFRDYGLNIVAAFDADPALAGKSENGCQIYPVSSITSLCKRLKIRIGIITVPSAHAQSVCDMLVDAGIKAIWNFAPTHLKAPDEILIQNENMAVSLAVLSKHLSEKYST